MDQMTIPKTFKGSRNLDSTKLNAGTWILANWKVNASYLPLAPAVPRKTAMLLRFWLVDERKHERLERDERRSECETSESAQCRAGLGLRYRVTQKRHEFHP